MRTLNMASAATYHSPSRSPLRNGTALDDLHPDRPLPGLFHRTELDGVMPPLEGAKHFEKCAHMKHQLDKLNRLVARVVPLDLSYVLAKDVVPYFNIKRDGTCGPKVPNHRDDPIDPLWIFMKAMPLVLTVLSHDARGSEGLDLDGLAYIVERLDEAKKLRVHESDIRFDVLEALLRLLSTILAKARAEVLA